MNFADRQGVIWYDGEYVEWREATTHVLTHTLHYGLGIYEGIRAYETATGSAIFRLDDHLQRLFNSAKIISMSIPYSLSELRNVAVQVLQKNQLRSAYLRPMCFYGSEGMGLHCKGLQTHVILAAWSWGEYLGQGALENGIRLKTSSFTRNHVNSLLSKAKVNGHYVNSMLALQEAEQAGFDEALMLDHQGFVAEGSGENFFMVRRGQVITPGLATILEGITRDTVMTLCAEAGMPVTERNITRDEVYLADEAFFTGTAAEITPIVALDGKTIGDGKPGPITRQLQKSYFSNVRNELSAHQTWLTLCEG